jgi:ABC-type transport system involved in multi-copper enzyme maturation permease subunit
MPFLTIARNACVESIRQPVFTVLLMAGIAGLVLNVNLAAFTLEDDDKLFLDLGLSTLFLTGLLLAVFTAMSVLTREIDNKTVLTVVSKPVSRPAVVIGKYLGVAAALAVGYATLAAVFLLAVRHRVQSSVTMDDTFDLPVLVFAVLFGGLAVLGAGLANYLFRRPFPSTFVIALALVFEAILVLAAVAIAASTRLGQATTLMTCLAVFGTGLVSEYFLGSVVEQAVSRPAWVRAACWPLYAAVPNLQFFWPADALTQGHPITISYLGTVTLYAALVATALLSLAVLLFQHRDVG